MSGLTFAQWWPLAALAIAVPLVVAFAALSRAGRTRPHRTLSSVVRVLALSALALALMRPTWVEQNTDVSVVYALDVSRSVDPAYVPKALDWITRSQSAAGTSRSRVVAFSDRVYPVTGAADIARVPLRIDGKGAANALDPLVTDVESALDAVASSFADDELKRVVLMTDGIATRGEAWNLVERLRARKVRVFTVPAPSSASGDVWVEGIDLPPELRRDEPVRVGVRLQAQVATNAVVRLRLGGKVLAEKRTALAAGASTVTFPVRLPDAGNAALIATVSADGDNLAENDSVTVNAPVAPRPRVLYAESNPESSRFLREALTAQGIDVTTTAPEQLPESRGPLEAFDAVILSDANAKALGEARMNALSAYVREFGGGLLFAAGANAFGEGGYKDSPLEQVLPATFEAQQKKRDLALVIVLDRSYSMKGRKLDLAKAATLGALELLEEEHRFGVITFDSQPEQTVPLAPVRSKRKAEDLISRFTASGQTNIFPALQMAYRMLVDVPIKAKHVILLYDGDTQPADFQRLAKRMADASISVTTVAITAEADTQLMENIANWGKGRYYYTESAEQVPQIFLQETRKLVNESLKEEPVKVAVKRKAEALRGIDFTTAPALQGMIATKPKDRAEVYLETRAEGPEAVPAPMLLRWQTGLGKSMLFASDVKNRWGTEWLTWPGYARLWSQLTREVMRRPTREETEFAVRADGDALVVRLAAVTPDGAFRNGLTPQVRVTGTSGAPLTVKLRQSGPGVYEVRIPSSAAPAGPWQFTLAGGVPAEVAAASGSRVLDRPFPAELRAVGTDTAFLKALAEQTGGRFDPQPQDVFDPLGEFKARPKALWPWFAAAGLLLYLLDVFLRRSPWVRRRV